MRKNIHDMFRLDGCKALVTGASSGLGRHFALTLANAGAEIVIAARRTERLADLVAEIEALGTKAYAISLDVTDTAGIPLAFDAIEQCTGGTGGVDIIVNNAGVTVTKPFLQQNAADWDLVVNTNLRGGWLVIQEGARRMVAAGRGGSIVNVASILGERVANSVAPYGISKAGLIQATKSAALELARHGIRVNALLPGYIVTDLNREFLNSEAGERLRARIPSRRFGLPEHLDGPLLLLASEAGAHMTGVALAVDGGHLVSSL